jgi:hypothetical protein
LINPGNVLVVDESLYEYNGDCPIKRYIPRKPHPNGLLVYGLAGYFNVGAHQLPYVLDFEPYVLESQVSAQGAMMALLNRLLERKPTLRPHLVVDSAFGSFDKLHDIMGAGGNATMSMASNVKPWLWELLDFKCGIDEGRLAFIPDPGIVIGSFKVISEAGNEHQIKTISSGCTLEEAEDQEDTVSSIVDRREVNGNAEYLTKFMDGHTDWLNAQSFIDDDGTTNLTWLHYVHADELKAAFESYTLSHLRVLALPCCYGLSNRPL